MRKTHTTDGKHGRMRRRHPTTATPRGSAGAGTTRVHPRLRRHRLSPCRASRRCVRQCELLCAGKQCIPTNSLRVDLYHFTRRLDHVNGTRSSSLGDDSSPPSNVVHVNRPVWLQMLLCPALLGVLCETSHGTPLRPLRVADPSPWLSAYSLGLGSDALGPLGLRHGLAACANQACKCMASPAPHGGHPASRPDTPTSVVMRAI